MRAKQGGIPVAQQAILDAVIDKESYAIEAILNLTVENPGLINIAGGLSTIEEKLFGSAA